MIHQVIMIGILTSINDVFSFKQSTLHRMRALLVLGTKLKAIYLGSDSIKPLEWELIIPQGFTFSSLDDISPQPFAVVRIVNDMLFIIFSNSL
jgi:hypothetical protein